jgi:hypothetical protein
MIARVRGFFEEGVPEDEPEFIVAVKAAKPKITASELRDVITQFRAVVSERQQRRLGRRQNFFQTLAALSESFRLRHLQ